MDNDFPAVMGNTPLGFLQTYIQGLQEYEQAGTDIPDLRLQNEYAQEMGGPLLENMEISGSPSFNINESGRTRKIRSIRNLQEGASGAEKQAAEEMLRRLGGAQLPKV